MLVRLEGINKVTKRLASGKQVTYYYAWKGGPRLPGKPGSKEFTAAYTKATSAKVSTPSNTFQSVINRYQESTDFTDRAARTKKDYVGHIKIIERKFGDMPITAVADPRARDEFLTWRDEMAAKSRRQADYTFATLARIISWAKNRNIIAVNQCLDPGKLYKSKRASLIWSEDDQKAILHHAPERLRLVFLMALYTGQRQGDLLKLTWNAYDGKYITLTQSKSGREVAIPVARTLKAYLDEAAKKRTAVTILTNSRGQPWTPDGFRTSWGKLCAKAQVETEIGPEKEKIRLTPNRTFHDIRGTAVTRLAEVGCSNPEIATITGHSLKDVETILEHYMARTKKMANSAIRKINEHEHGT